MKNERRPVWAEANVEIIMIIGDIILNEIKKK